MCGTDGKPNPTFGQPQQSAIKLPFARHRLVLSVELSHHRTHLRQAGDLLHPEREPQTVLNALKKSMGSMDFAAQYQQSPVIEGGNLIKWKWFARYDKLPDRKSTDRIVVSWDTASSAKELASYSACVVMQ